MPSNEALIQVVKIKDELAELQRTLSLEDSINGGLDADALFAARSSLQTIEGYVENLGTLLDDQEADDA